jgi:hypothetical protein
MTAASITSQRSIALSPKLSALLSAVNKRMRGAGMGVKVAVTVGAGVDVGVSVGKGVDVSVGGLGVFVGVATGVSVGVAVGGAVAVAVGGGAQISLKVLSGGALAEEPITPSPQTQPSTAPGVAVEADAPWLE